MKTFASMLSRCALALVLVASSRLFADDAGQFAIRQHDWLLINAKSGGMSAVPAWFDEEYGYKDNPHAGELYNLRSDLAEKHNLYAQQPAKVAELRTLLAQIQKGGGSAPRLAAEGVKAGTGIMVSEVTAESAYAQVRLSKSETLVDGDLPGTEGVVEFTCKPAAAKGEGSLQGTIEAVAEHDFIARLTLDRLTPDTQYIVSTRIGRDRESLAPGPTATFRTLPGAAVAKPVKFVVVTGMNYAKFHGDDRINRAQHLLQNNTELPESYQGADKHLGYPALVSILKTKPDFFVGTGDNVYYDTPTKPRAETLPQMRKKWHEQFVQPRFRDLFAAVPTYWEIDDHDFRVDDSDNSGNYNPTPELGRKVMLEQLPIAPQHSIQAKTYRTHRVSKDLQIWLTEGRLHRSPNAMPDGPEKTLWGAEQKAWLKQTLAESDATFKLLISPTPMIGPDDLRKTDNHCDIGGFRHERDEFFAWIKEQGLDRRGFAIVCGDRHWQYHSIDPSGLEEFSCGALVDANSRLGRKPGDPKSTDPDALIKQPYYQTPRSGGFLQIEVTPAIDGKQPRIEFTWHHTQGKVLHRHAK